MKTPTTGPRQGDTMPDPRNQPDGVHDQDKHGRKQNTGRNAPPGRSAADDARQAPGGPAHGGGSGKDRAGSGG